MTANQPRWQLVKHAQRYWQLLKWYVGSIMGDRAYDRYLAHLSAVHPEAPQPSVGEYWRARHAEAEARPGMRCC